LRDIIEELGRPGRDPRKTFEPPRFREDVTEMEHLEAGMRLEGLVTNVTAFGAFVDVGVHQDGLVHVSELADRFVKDPHEVVKVGQKVSVRVLDVDLERKRISLSARSATTQGNGAPGAHASGGARHAPAGKRHPGSKDAGSKESDTGRRSRAKRKSDRRKSRADRFQKSKGFRNNPFADLLDKLEE
jgi:uncharacterized protein